jgi:hypothetical protein
MPESSAFIPAVPPSLVQDVFSEQELAQLFRVLRTSGPWPLIAGIYFRSVDELLAVSGRADVAADKAQLEDFLTPAFRGILGNNGLCYYDDLHEIFYSRKLLDSVKQMYGARYGAPYLFQFNLQGPSHGLDGGHFDGRSWRGMDPTNTPAWLMSVMAKSGLFDHWGVKAGQVITYFYDSSIDGGFTYWPDGPEGEPQRFVPPFWNSGIVTDNQRMFHRGEACGPRDRRDLPSGFSLQSRIRAVGENDWEVVDDDKVIARYAAGEVRLLIHYSAHVFDDMTDLKRYFDHTDDLTPDQALNMLMDDLRLRGVSFDIPSDPLNDPVFIDTLSRTYAVQPARFPPEAPLDSAA